jgi:phage gpG-like protein
MTDDVLSVQWLDSEAQRLFAEMIRRGSNMAPLMADIGELLTESTQRRFDTGVGPDGVAWLPLSQKTLLSHIDKTKGNYTKKGQLSSKGAGRVMARKPLVNSGRMRDDISPRSGADFVEIAAHAKQARWHQFGTSPYIIEPKGKKALAFIGGDGEKIALRRVHHPGLPARPFLGVSADDERSILRLAADYLQGAG